MRFTEFAPVQTNEPAQQPTVEPLNELAQQPTIESANEPPLYGPPRWAHRSFTKGFAGADFALQPDGTLRCPTGHPLTVQERRPERNGSLRLVYGARACHCRPCPLRAQCQESATTLKPRQVSAVFWPIKAFTSASDQPPSASLMMSEPPLPPPLPTLHPILWGDWPRCQLRRQWMRLLRTQTVTLTLGSAGLEENLVILSDHVQTRAQRAHWRLCWNERMGRNARRPQAAPLKVTIYGLPPSLAQYLHCSLVTAA
jgi:hypothetical protein